MVRPTTYLDVTGTATRARELAALVQAQQLPFLAAAIAYYAFLSVIPLLVVALAVATVLAGDTITADLVDSLDRFLTPEAADLLESTLVEAPGRGGVTLLGVVLLLWGALRVFRGLDIAFSQVYGTAVQKSLPQQLRDATLVLVAVALATGATVLGSTLLSLSPVGLSGLGGSLGLAVVLPVVFFPLYYVFPAGDVTVREAVPGAVVAGTGWTVLGTVFGLYASRAGSFELYGVLGGVLLLLVWFYFAGLVLLLGAALNALLAGRLGDRQLQQGGPPETNQQETMGGTAGSDQSRSDTDEGSTGGSAENGAGRDRVPDGGSADRADEGRGPDGATPDPAGEADDDPGMPGVQSLQLTRGDIPRYRGERPASDAVSEEDLDALRDRVEEFETEIEGRTVDRQEVERELRRYVRRRTRRGRARGWGPYLVLLYGTAMTLGAFVFLSGGWAILAMLVIWLSTLGLYVLMLIVGVTLGALGIPRRVLDRLGKLRG